eukprot:TRINITY_DN5267_c0_g1_i6.p3 TRINITY_DN5267_c0_g1~~TRINITY_DN5267_c0_g1_i6.p3  ORF type:complete len:131 (-),score=4.26 TRINITY_DN5267_c0_g1_i6:309-701(-)
MPFAEAIRTGQRATPFQRTDRMPSAESDVPQDGVLSRTADVEEGSTRVVRKVLQQPRPWVRTGTSAVPPPTVCPARQTQHIPDPRPTFEGNVDPQACCTVISEHHGAHNESCPLKNLLCALFRRGFIHTA